MLNIESVTVAMVAQNQSYIARKGINAALNKNGMQGDIADGLKHWVGFTVPMYDELSKVGITEEQVITGIKNTRNVKVALRLPQILAFIATGSVTHLQGSAKTLFYEVGALAMGAKTRAALFFAATGKGDENTSDVINVPAIRKLQKVAGLIGATTEQTQNSVSFAKDNLGDVLGIATKAGRNALPVVNTESPVLKALIARAATLSDLDFERLAEKGRKGK